METNDTDVGICGVPVIYIAKLVLIARSGNYFSSGDSSRQTCRLPF
jgi:hypothetical protein